MSEDKMKNAKSRSCRCGSRCCPRNGNCPECIKYHHACNTKTSCGK